MRTFQSTLPARGATATADVNQGNVLDFNPRSPHGERRRAKFASQSRSRFQSTLPARGATVTRMQSPTFCRAFQSTLPARGATAPSPDPNNYKQFQSTLPARGATLRTYPVDVRGTISIHAPRTGSDPSILCQFEQHFLFQSTLPARGATKSIACRSLYFQFQSTLPARGAT